MSALLSAWWRIAWRWPGLMMILALLLCFELVVLSGLPYSFRFLVDEGIVAGNESFLKSLLLALAIAAVFYALLGVWRDAQLARLQARMLSEYRRRMLVACQQAPLSWFAQIKRSDLMSRFAGDLNAIEHALLAFAPWALVPGLEVLMNTVLLFTLDWRLALMGLLALPVALLGPRLLLDRASSLANARRSLEAGLLGHVDQQLRSQTLERALAIQMLRREEFEKLSAQLEAAHSRQSFLSASLERSANVAVILLNVAILGYGSWLVLRHDLTIGELAAFQTLFLSLSWALSYLAQYAPIGVSAVASQARIDAVWNAPQLKRPGKKRFARLSRGIRLDRVGLKFGDHVVLKETSLSVSMARSLALVGASGSGKSTLLSLLLGFEQPSTGRVLIDDVDLAELELESWRKHIGVLFQDTFIFDASVRANLSVAREDASASEIELAARQAGLHDVICALPKGYDTLLGESGTALSGGQRQRLGLARVLLRSPSLILLDEPTSALDVMTEQLLEQQIFSLARGRTLLLVTHRLQQAARCDQIVVLGGGNALEVGSHEQLLERQGPYAQMWRKQQGFRFDAGKVHIQPERLKEVPLFADLSIEVLQDIAGLFTSEHISAGSTIVTEGEVGDRFYLIARGMAEVYRRDSKGTEQSLAILNDGDPFGEIALLTARPRTAHVRALMDCALLTLSKQQLDRLVEEQPEVGSRMRTTAIERLRLLRS